MKTQSTLIGRAILATTLTLVIGVYFLISFFDQKINIDTNDTPQAAHRWLKTIKTNSNVLYQ